MANQRTMRRPIETNVNKLHVLCGKATFAADAEANGCTVSDGGGNWLTSITRTGEGLWTLTLKRKYKKFVGVRLGGNTRTDSTLELVSAPAANFNTIALRFIKTSTGAAEDPDAAVIYPVVEAQDSGLDY